MFPTSPTQTLLDARDMSDVKGYRDKLNQRMAHLKSEIQALEGCYNSVSWPNRLPPEILSQIFILVASYSRSRYGREDLKWISVTHVCRHWRQTALDCLALWTDLSFVNAEFTRVMIKRSQSAPLSVCYGWNDEKIPFDVLSDALAMTQRLRSIILASCREPGERLALDPLLSVIARTAPALEHLEVYVFDNRQPVTLPTKFLEGTAPNLKCLRLNNIRFLRWNDLPLPRPALTRLEIGDEVAFYSNHNPIPDSARPSWTQLLAALQEMPALQTLTLEALLPNGKPPIQSSAMPITLYNLRSLKLADSASKIAALASAIRFPSASNLQIVVNDTQDTSHLRPLLDLLTISCDWLHKGSVRELDCVHSMICERVKFVFRVVGNEPRGGDSNFVFCYAQDPQPDSNELTMTFHEHMDLSHLSKASFLSDVRLTRDTWMATFGTYEDLTDLNLKYDAFPEALAHALGSAAKDDSKKAAFPALTSLNFVCQYFDPQSTDLLISALRSRPPTSQKMRLTFCSHCSFDEGMFDLIAKSLPHVALERQQQFGLFER